MHAFNHGGPSDCACLARTEPRPDFDMKLADRLILTEAQRIFPGDSRRFEVHYSPVFSMRDEVGPMTLYAKDLVEILPKRTPEAMTEDWREGEEEQGPDLWRPNDMTILIVGQYASSRTLATEGLLNMARMTPEFGGAEPVRAGDLKEFKDDLCAVCGKQRWRPRSSGPATGEETK